MSAAAAVHVRISVCFLIHVTASEVSAVVGDGQLRRLFFHHRSSECHQTRRQHIHAPPEGSRLGELIDCLRKRQPA